MSKKLKPTSIDFDFGVGDIIPSTQEVHRHGEGEKQSLTIFKKTVGTDLDSRLASNEQFPSDGEVFIFILQYFTAEDEYHRRDIDNMAKTILDILKSRLYHDDSQVRTLLVGKKIEQRVPQNFAYVAVKKLSKTQDVDALKISGIERSVTLFQELKSKGYFR